MATAIQKNGIKSLRNSNPLVHQVQEFQTFNDMIHQNQYIEQESSSSSIIETIDENHIIIKKEENEVEEEENTQEELPELDIMINNVVCSFSVQCHLNLREIALNGMNVEYRKENGMITMKIRDPYTTASIWSSGKITCTGATSEESAKKAARKFARCLQKLGFNTRFNNYRVVNVLGTCSMPFAIRINSFSEKYREADYEPELHPGVTYKLHEPKATLKIFSTGSITVTAPCVADVQAAIVNIFPMVYEFRKERSKEELELLAKKKMRQGVNLESDLITEMDFQEIDEHLKMETDDELDE